MKNLIIFGSARERLGPKYYKIAYEVAYKAADMGYSTRTGAGPGIMESANEGCSKAGGFSQGIRINLPFEQDTNEYIDELKKFDNFPERKAALLKNADAFVVMPGGLGTLDELFEVLTLMQCNMLDKKPVVLVGRKFWDPLYYFLVNNLSGITMDREDLDLFTIVDTVDEILGEL